MQTTPATQNVPDAHQYSLARIRLDEELYGRNFFSAGGAVEIDLMLRTIEPARPSRVLEIGSGLGGPSFMMARRYGASVDGVEVLGTMFTLSCERVREERLEEQVRFYQGDFLAFEAQHRYDLVFSSSAFLHFRDKAALLGRVRGALEPGGILLFSDYCRGVDGPEMRAYAEEFGYDIHPMDGWRDLLVEHGFVDVVAEDCTARFQRYSEETLAREGLSERWVGIMNQRLHRVRSGQHRYCVFRCRRG